MKKDERWQAGCEQEFGVTDSTRVENLTPSLKGLGTK